MSIRGRNNVPFAISILDFVPAGKKTLTTGQPSLSYGNGCRVLKMNMPLTIKCHGRRPHYGPTLVFWVNRITRICISQVTLLFSYKPCHYMYYMYCVIIMHAIVLKNKIIHAHAHVTNKKLSGKFVFICSTIANTLTAASSSVLATSAL